MSRRELQRSILIAQVPVGIRDGPPDRRKEAFRGSRPGLYDDRAAGGNCKA